ncbi:MAG: hypothetical protein ABIA08_02810 [bacterium]
MSRKIIAIFLILGIFIPSLSFAYDLPENEQEAQELLEKGLEVGEKELPGMVKSLWTDEVLPVWGKIYNWFKDRIWPIFFNWFKKEIEPELEKRRPQLEEEFEKEKTEVKEELPKVGRSLWDKFKEIIQ